MEQENKTDSIELIKPKITDDHQVLAALTSTGAGFEALGGSSLMLCEAVENGVDSIIEARRDDANFVGKIEVIIDKKEEAVIVIDNGLGFTNPRHICEKPFDSLKKYDPELTGKFARGIQGFRSYCDNLIFITRRKNIPNNGSFGGEKGNTLRLEFSAGRIEVGCSVVSDSEFYKWVKSDHGAVAFYTVWKKGEFQKINKNLLTKRIEHHFGELIRKGQVEILIWEGKEKLIRDRRVDLHHSYACAHRDYSQMKKIIIPPMPYLIGGAKQGEIVFELYLTERAKRDKWLLSFLMYKGRPVGDNHISEIEEFGESSVWSSNYLTGFIRCDFCRINELRLALKPGPEREFLYEKMDEIESTLEKEIKAHHEGLTEIKMQQEINELVSRLQNFLKLKNIFHFKIAKQIGSLSTDEKLDKIHISEGVGQESNTVYPSKTGDEQAETIDGSITVNVNGRVTPNQNGNQFVTSHVDTGRGSGTGSNVVSGSQPDDTANLQGYQPDGGGDKKSLLESVQATNGNLKKTKKRARHRRSRGFNITLHSDEFENALSWFDPVTSTVIVNSAHERYKKRDDPTNPSNREVLNYLGELYIWEICKLAKQTKEKEANTQIDATDLFLEIKFEFFEKGS